MDEKLAIEAFIALRKEWFFYVKANDMAKAAQIFQKMVELGNKYPLLASYINTAQLGPEMLSAGFTASEAGTAVGIIETTVATETVSTTTAGAVSMAAFVPVMTVGAAIALAVVLGGVAFILYNNWNKDRAHKQFVNYARRSFGGNRGFRPFLGNVH